MTIEAQPSGASRHHGSQKSEAQTARHRGWAGGLGLGRWALLGVLVLAILPRAALAVRAAGEPLSGDEIDYDALARTLIATGRYESHNQSNALLQSPPGLPTAYRAPGLPAFLAFVYLLGGDDPLTPRLLLAILNGLACVLVSLIARETTGHWQAGVVSGALWAIWPASVGLGSTAILTEPLATPLLLLGSWFLLRGAASNQLLQLALGGLTLGACALVRANLVLMAAAAAAWAVLLPGRFESRVRRGLVVSGLVAAVVVPWMLRNYRVLGVFTITTQREVLFLGNNAWARGSYDGEFFKGSSSEQVRWLLERHPRLPQMLDTEKAAVYTSEALKFLASNPAHALYLSARKAVLFWTPQRQAGAGVVYDVAFGTLVPFFLVGLASISGGRRYSQVLLLLPVISSLATCVLVFFMPRYRLPAEPFMVVLGVAGGLRLERRLGLRGILAAVSLLAALNVAIERLLWRPGQAAGAVPGSAPGPAAVCNVAIAPANPLSTLAPYPQ